MAEDRYLGVPPAVRKRMGLKPSPSSDQEDVGDTQRTIGELIRQRVGNRREAEASIRAIQRTKSRSWDRG